MKEKHIYHNQLLKLLVFFLKAKNKIVKNLTGINLFNKEDYEDASEWSSTEISRFFFCMETNNFYFDDKILCPWCTFYLTQFKDTLCECCGYGKRHIPCIYPVDSVQTTVNIESNYGKILERLNNFNGTGISGLYKIISLRDMTIKLFAGIETKNFVPEKFLDQKLEIL